MDCPAASAWGLPADRLPFAGCSRTKRYRPPQADGWPRPRSRRRASRRNIVTRRSSNPGIIKSVPGDRKRGSPEAIAGSSSSEAIVRPILVHSSHASEAEIDVTTNIIMVYIWLTNTRPPDVAVLERHPNILGTTIARGSTVVWSGAYTGCAILSRCPK
jgi:hypothetical protein